jgi:hypothetical protein
MTEARIQENIDATHYRNGTNKMVKYDESKIYVDIGEGEAVDNAQLNNMKCELDTRRTSSQIVNDYIDIGNEYSRKIQALMVIANQYKKSGNTYKYTEVSRLIDELNIQFKKHMNMAK